MKSPFFITGLPRSRTLWMATYFSSLPGVECHHELLNRCRSKDEFYEAMSKPGIIGNSDCGLFLTDFQKRWPRAPTLIIHRPVKTVVRSLGKLGIPFPEEVAHRISERNKNLKGLHVQYHMIDKIMDVIHGYLTPHVPYDRRRAEEFCTKVITLDKIEGSPEAMAIWR